MLLVNKIIEPGFIIFLPLGIQRFAQTFTLSGFNYSIL